MSVFILSVTLVWFSLVIFVFQNEIWTAGARSWSWSTVAGALVNCVNINIFVIITLFYFIIIIIIITLICFISNTFSIVSGHWSTEWMRAAIVKTKDGILFQGDLVNITIITILQLLLVNIIITITSLLLHTSCIPCQ